MATNYDKAREELDEILAGMLTDKKKNQSDKRLIAIKNRENDPNYQLIKKNKILSDEANKKRSNSSRESLAKPEVKEKMKRSRQRLENDPLYKKRMEKVYNDPIRLEKCIKGGQTQSREVSTPCGIFPSRLAASKFYKISPHTMGGWIKKNKPHLFYYTDTGPGIEPQPIIKYKPKKYIRKVKTPDGIFDNIHDAAIFYNVHPDTIKYRIKTDPNNYIRLDNKPKKSKVMTPDGLFENIDQAAIFYKKSTKTIRVWMKNSPTKYFYE